MKKLMKKLKLKFSKHDDAYENVIYKEIAHIIIETMNQKTERKCLEFKLKSGNPGILDSKIGGVPFIPVGGEYPVSTDSGELLYLLAQINFEQIPHLQDFPTKGILQFFIGGDDLYGSDYENNEQKSWRMVYYEDISSPMDEKDIENLMDKQKKGDDVMLPFEEPGQSYFMELEEVMTPMAYYDYRYNELFIEELKKLGIKEFNDIDDFYLLPDKLKQFICDDFYDNFYDELSGRGSRIGGYPGFIQGDPREYDENYKDYELLLQVDSECVDGEWIITWGDCGVANFLIHPEDLKKLDFSKVLYNCDCC